MSTKKYYWGILVALIIIIILILGNIFWSSRLSQYQTGSFWNFNQDINLSSPQYSSAGFIIQGPRRVYINQDLKIEENLAYFNEAVLGVFLKNEDAKLGYVVDNELLSGLIISSDGWVLLNSLGQEGIVNRILQDKASYVVVAKKDNKIYEIEDFVKASSSGLSLLKIKNSNSFPVKNFINTSSLRNGQSLLAYNFSGQVSVNFLSSIESGSNPKLFRSFKNNILLDSPLGADFRGGFVFDLSGDLLALIGNDSRITPVHDFRPYIFGFLKNKEFQVFDLGVHYVDLRDVIIEGKPAYGALIYNNGLPAIVEGSLAESAGLMDGDVITKINNYEINNYSSLNDVWNNFVSGDKLTISVLRDSEIIDLKIEIK